MDRRLTRSGGRARMPGTEPGENTQVLTIGREPAVEARSLAYLYAAGAGLEALTLALPHSSGQGGPCIQAASPDAGLGALLLLFGASRIPAWTVEVFLAIGTLLISCVVHFSGTGNSAFAFYYVWVGIYGFSFLPRGGGLAHARVV